MRGAQSHVSASCDGYGHDIGRHPSSRMHVLDRNSDLSCLVMYSAWMLFLSWCPTNCTEMGMKPSTSSFASFAALITVSVLIRFVLEHSTDAPARFLRRRAGLSLLSTSLSLYRSNC